AVVRITIMGEAIFVAFAAALVAGHFEMAVLWCFNFVCSVAVSADRATCVPLCHQLPVHALVIGLFDSHMAFATGLGHVGGVNWRVPIDRAFDVMRPMAIVAGGRDNEAHVEQRPAVDAVHVLAGSLGVLHL